MNTFTMGKMKIILEEIVKENTHKPFCIEGELSACTLLKQDQYLLDSPNQELAIEGMFDITTLKIKNAPAYSIKHAKLNSCKHKNIEGMDWPDGSYVELCKDCGFSRNLWEQGSSDWMMVKDVKKEKERIQQAVDLFKDPKKYNSLCQQL